MFDFSYDIWSRSRNISKTRLKYKIIFFEVDITFFQTKSFHIRFERVYNTHWFGSPWVKDKIVQPS